VTGSSNINSGGGTTTTMRATLSPCPARQSLPHPPQYCMSCSSLWKRTRSQSSSACMPPDINTWVISSHALCMQELILDMDGGGPGASGGRFPLRVRLAACGRQLKSVEGVKQGVAAAAPAHVPATGEGGEFAYSRCACVGGDSNKV
jgi:hypothetical protein